MSLKGEKKDFQKCPLDEQPTRESGRRRILRNWNELNHKGQKIPISNWLQSHLGEDWDTIYSLLKKWLKDKVANPHTRDYDLNWYVNINCTKEGEFVFDQHGYLISHGRGWREFYVDPETNKLCKSVYIDPSKRNRKKPEFFWKDKDKLIQYKQFAGVWYECQLRKADKTEEWYNKVLKGHYFLFNMWGGNYVLVSKKQMNKKEIKKAKLR